MRAARRRRARFRLEDPPANKVSSGAEEQRLFAGSYVRKSESSSKTVRKFTRSNVRKFRDKKREDRKYGGESDVAFHPRWTFEPSNALLPSSPLQLQPDDELPGRGESRETGEGVPAEMEVQHLAADVG